MPHKCRLQHHRKASAELRASVAYSRLVRGVNKHVRLVATHFADVIRIIRVYIILYYTRLFIHCSH
jgi:hypothetical protein